MLNSLLIYRLIIINLIGLIGLGYAAWTGWVTYIVTGDSSHLVYVMAAMFVLFLVSLFIRASKVSHVLDRHKAGQTVGISGTKFLEKNAHLDDFPTWITLMGLLGNVIGVAIALNAIHPADLADAASTQQAMSRLMDGMHVAFTTTIAGCVLAFWAEVNRRVLKTATVLMVEDDKALLTDLRIKAAAK